MSTISAVKSWSSNEVLTASDLNAEFSNLITNCNSLNSDNLDMTANYTWTGNLQGASITATAAFLPDASGGANIGSASLEFGDLYLADTKTIYFGNDQDITLAHVADTGLTLTGSHANGTNLQLNNTATDGDAAIKFALSGTVAYSLGVEDGDSDKFVINYGTGALGAQPALEIDSSGNTSIAGTLGTTGAATLASLVCTAAATFGGGTGSSGATISTAGAGTFDGILKTEDTTEATSTTDGSLQTDGGLSVAKDAIIGDDLKLLSDSAVLSLGDGSDATLTHDGTTGVTIAANPIVVDSGGNLTLDAHTGIHIFKDAGTEVLRFTEGNSGDVTVKLATDGKDLVFTDNGDATNMKILDAAAGINVPGEVQTTGIGYTDGDNAITIADGGGCTFPQSATFTSGFSNNDQNITNVGNIALDTISSDAGTTVSVTLGTDAGDDFIVGNNNALVVEGDNDRVGIGTASPDTAMHIYNGSAGSVTAISGAALTIEDDAASYLQFLNPADTEAGIIFGRGTDNNHAGMFYGSDEQLYFSANNAERMRISSAGSLSLGATAVGGSPGAGSVEFQKDGNNYVRFWDNATATFYMQSNAANAPTTAMKNSDSDSLDITTFQRTNAGGTILGQSRNGLMLISGAPNGSFAVGTSNAKDLVLGTNNTEKLRITSAGKVGINITDPEDYSDASGTTLVVGNTSGTTTRSGVSIITDTSGIGRLAFGDGAGDPDQWKGLIQYTQSSDTMGFACNGQAVEMSLVGGDLGIGTASPGARLEISDTTAPQLLVHGTSGNVTGTSIDSYMESSSPADNDFAGAYGVYYKDDGGTKVQVGSSGWFVTDVSAGTIDSYFYLRVYSNNSAVAGTLSSSGVWTDSSAAANKKYYGTRQEVWPDGVLPKLKTLRVSKYKQADLPDDKPVTETHVSPTAEDFWDAFQIGQDPRREVLNAEGEQILNPSIAPKDLSGVALVAIQELLDRVEAAEAKIAALEAA